VLVPPSFRKVITQWVRDPLQHTGSITVLFGAIAFLSYQGVLKYEFYYPNIRLSVFTRELQVQLVPQQQPPQQQQQQ
jgi:hypothetical protein